MLGVRLKPSIKSVDTRIMDEINGTCITLHKLSKSKIKRNSI